jgi:hypothetical protein
MEVKAKKKSAEDWQKILPYNELISDILRIRDLFATDSFKARNLAKTLEKNIPKTGIQLTELQDYFKAGKSIFSMFNIRIEAHNPNRTTAVMPWANKPSSATFYMAFVLDGILDKSLSVQL